MSIYRAQVLAVIYCGVVHIVCADVSAGTKVTIGQPVPAGKRVSIDRIDHSQWNTLLKKYVDSVGRVDYAAWQHSTSDVRALDSYLASLSYADPRIQSSREAQLAYWINAYNAATIKGVLREYPTSSIRNHTAKLYGYNIWHDLLLAVGNTKISLNDIEHKVLRKMGEPRVHFAIVCASHSCPRLLNEAYAAKTVEQQLTTNSRNFFASRENFQYTNGAFYLSSILKWFAEDFGANRSAQLRSIAPYLPEASAQQAAAAGLGRISYLEYDWSLNEQPTARNARRR